MEVDGLRTQIERMGVESLKTNKDLRRIRDVYNAKIKRVEDDLIDEKDFSESLFKNVENVIVMSSKKFKSNRKNELVSTKVGNDKYDEQLFIEKRYSSTKKVSKKTKKLSGVNMQLSPRSKKDGKVKGGRGSGRGEDTLEHLDYVINSFEQKLSALKNKIC